jgi:hypothetical protein
MNRIKITLNLISIAVLQKVPIISLNVQIRHLPLVGFKAHTHIVDICASPSFSLVVVIIIIFAVVVAIGNLWVGVRVGFFVSISIILLVLVYVVRFLLDGLIVITGATSGATSSSTTTSLFCFRCQQCNNKINVSTVNERIAMR